MPCAVTHARLTRRRTQWCVGNTRAGFVRRAVGVTFHQPLLRVAVLADGTVVVPTLFALLAVEMGPFLNPERVSCLREFGWRRLSSRSAAVRAHGVCVWGTPQARRI